MGASRSCRVERATDGGGRRFLTKTMLGTACLVMLCGDFILLHVVWRFHCHRGDIREAHGGPGVINGQRSDRLRATRCNSEVCSIMGVAGQLHGSPCVMNGRVGDRQRRPQLLRAADA